MEDHGDPTTGDPGRIHPAEKLLEPDRQDGRPIGLVGQADLVAGGHDERLRQRGWLAVWDEAVDQAQDDVSRLLAVFDALDHFRGRPHGARWCAFLGTSAEYADPPPVLAAAIQRDTDDLRTRLTALAEPVVGSRAAELAEELMLVVSGDLAMRLRTGRSAEPCAARRIAEAVVARMSAA